MGTKESIPITCFGFWPAAGAMEAGKDPVAVYYQVGTERKGVRLSDGVVLHQIESLDMFTKISFETFVAFVQKAIAQSENVQLDDSIFSRVLRNPSDFLEGESPKRLGSDLQMISVEERLRSIATLLREAEELARGLVGHMDDYPICLREWSCQFGTGCTRATQKSGCKACPLRGEILKRMAGIAVYLNPRLRG